MKLVYVHTVLAVYGPSTSHTISGDEDVRIYNLLWINNTGLTIS